MSLYIGSSFFPACISCEDIHKIHMSDISPVLSIWEKIKEFLFTNHHDQELDCLFKLCHPRPDISRKEVNDLFWKLRALAAPGCMDNFIIEDNNSSGTSHYRIIDKNGDDILSIFYGSIRIIEPESSWEQTMCLPRTVIP